MIEEIEYATLVEKACETKIALTKLECEESIENAKLYAVRDAIKKAMDVCDKVINDNQQMIKLCNYVKLHPEDEDAYRMLRNKQFKEFNGTSTYWARNNEFNGNTSLINFADYPAIESYFKQLLEQKFVDYKFTQHTTLMFNINNDVTFDGTNIITNNYLKIRMEAWMRNSNDESIIQTTNYIHINLNMDLYKYSGNGTVRNLPQSVVEEIFAIIDQFCKKELAKQGA